MSELSYLQACVLGLVQGLTEFLPVSSSGHLVIVQQAFGLTSDAPAMLLFDVMTHIGTLASVLVVFAGTVGRYGGRLAAELGRSFTGRRTGWWILGLAAAACSVTAVMGFGFRDTLERAFASLWAIGGGLLITGTLLFSVGRLPRPRRGWRRIGVWRAALVGLAQGCAICPGISRSGATICIAMMLGIKRRWAAEFSFLIAAPVILGAGLIELGEAISLPAAQLQTIRWGPIVAGTLMAFVSGVLALRILLAMVISNKIQHFCYYCWTLGAAVLIWSVVGPSGN